ncbi:MAG: hypothetical protein WCC87_03475 [Candidatus Korobacteraceae bacterium]
MLKNSREQIPRRLKPARDDKSKGLIRGAEAPHYPNRSSRRVFQQTVKPVDFATLAAWLNRVLKNSKKQISHRLKSVRDDKYKGLATAQLKLRPFKITSGRVFQQTVKPCPFKTELNRSFPDENLCQPRMFSLGERRAPKLEVR